MGFSLEVFFDELEHILSSDVKASKKVGRINHAVASAKKYAIECGDLPRNRPPKK